MHRDLKLLNIFCCDLDSYPTVKIGDFGTAALLDQDEMVTDMVGTVGYMAPEVALGQPAGIKADMWSLGVILYILLS